MRLHPRHGTGSRGFELNRCCWSLAPLPLQIYVIFRLQSYFQNYRRYVRSLDSQSQHSGSNTTSPSSACQPFSYVGPGDNPGPNSSLYANGAINPCGQIAHSNFNDTYELVVGGGAGGGLALSIDQSNIAWSQDYKLYGDFIPFNYNRDPDTRGGATVDKALNTDQHWMVRWGGLGERLVGRGCDGGGGWHCGCQRAGSRGGDGCCPLAPARARRCGCARGPRARWRSYTAPSTPPSPRGPT